MSDTVAKRFAALGLPYEITDVEIGFVLSGASGGEASVIALYQYGDARRQFTGFHGLVEAAPVAREARRVKGCYAAYVVTANAKE